MKEKNVTATEMMGLVSGYVLTASGFPTVYRMSDCKWEECIRQTIEQFSPDYIIVNSGGALFPEFSRTEGSIIPDEQEVLTMLDELPAHIKLIAVHTWKLPIMGRPHAQFCVTKSCITK